MSFCQHLRADDNVVLVVINVIEECVEGSFSADGISVNSDWTGVGKQLHQVLKNLFCTVSGRCQLGKSALRTLMWNTVSGFAMVAQQLVFGLVIRKTGIAVGAHENISAVVADEFL